MSQHVGPARTNSERMRDARITELESKLAQVSDERAAEWKRAENAEAKNERLRGVVDTVCAGYQRGELKDQRLAAENERLKAELAHWKTCSMCGEQMEQPGHCSRGESEQVAGLSQMVDDILTRAEQAERQLAEVRSVLSQFKASEITVSEFMSRLAAILNTLEGT